MKFILIMIFVPTHGTAVSTQEFNTEKACRDALTVLVDANSRKGLRLKSIACVPKGAD